MQWLCGALLKVDWGRAPLLLTPFRQLGLSGPLTVLEFFVNYLP